MRKLVVLCLAILLAAALPFAAQAVPAFPGQRSLLDEVTGETVACYLRGGEHFSYYADLQGRIIERDASGRLRYITAQGEGYALAGYVTGEGAFAPQDALTAGDVQAVQAWLLELRQNRAARQRARNAQIPDGYYENQSANDPLKGSLRMFRDEEYNAAYPAREATCPLLVLKVNYANVVCAFDDAAWHQRIFRDGVVPFYSENSNGTFTYEPARENSGTADDGVISVTLPIKCPLYNKDLVGIERGIYTAADGSEYALCNESMLFAYALEASRDVIDFASYDRNGDKRIDPTELAFLMVLPGEDASWCTEGANGRPGAWPHSWEITVEDSSGDAQYYMMCTVDGVDVHKYTVVVENQSGNDGTGKYPETEADCYDYYNPQGSAVPATQAQWGVAAHELAHDLGARDLYDTINGTDPYVGRLSLMADGSWGCAPGEPASSRPTHLDPYHKIELGFCLPQLAEGEGPFALTAASEPGYNVLMIMKSNVQDGCYLVENRQFSGYDKGMTTYYDIRRGGGIVVWEINAQVIEKGWYYNRVNTAQGGYGIVPISWPARYPAGTVYRPFFNRNTIEVLLPTSRFSEMKLLSPDGETMTIGLVSRPVTPPVTGDAAAPAWWAVGAAAALGLIAALLLRERRMRRADGT